MTSIVSQTEHYFGEYRPSVQYAPFPAREIERTPTRELRTGDKVRLGLALAATAVAAWVHIGGTSESNAESAAVVRAEPAATAQAWASQIPTTVSQSVVRVVETSSLEAANQPELALSQAAIIESFTSLTSVQKDFLRKAVPAAQKLTAEGVPISAPAVIAQAIIESGWGQQVAGNNLFGIKADPSWRGATVRVPTVEYVNGVRHEVFDTFRAYDSYHESFVDYAKLIMSEDWAQDATHNADNPRTYLEGLQNEGPNRSYATAPNYVNDVMHVVDDFQLVELTSL